MGILCLKFFHFHFSGCLVFAQSQILLFLFLGFFCFFPPIQLQVSSQPLSAHDHSITAIVTSVNYTESFFLDNSSEQGLIIWLMSIPTIGQKWNVSFFLDNGSTSSLNCTITTRLWDGPATFLLNPGDAVSHIYISHVCGDNYDVVMLSFRLQLTNRTGEASGVFLATRLSSGYANPPECGTGQIYVSNITEWRYTQLSSSSVIESSTTTNSFLSISENSTTGSSSLPPTEADLTTTPSIPTSVALTNGWDFPILLLVFITILVNRLRKRTVL